MTWHIRIGSSRTNSTTRHCRVLHEAAELADASKDVFLFAVRLACALEEFAQQADALPPLDDPTRSSSAAASEPERRVARRPF